MSWKDILKEDNINKGFSWFMPKDKENPIDKFLPDIKRILDGGGNVIIQTTNSTQQEKTFFDNGTLSIGLDVLGQDDPKQAFKELTKTLPSIIGDKITITDSSISGMPSITIALSNSQQQRNANPDKDY